MTLLVEEAISQDLIIERGHFSPTGSEYDHYRPSFEKNECCGVSIIRAGDSMVGPISQLIPGIAIGKILIQRDEATAEPVFYYTKLPTNIKKMKKVYLLDPMLATGGSASMAVDKIIENGVPASNITFINLVCCSEGIARLQRDHPDMNILTAHIDPILNNRKYIIPGLGDYGDRYFNSNSE